MFGSKFIDYSMCNSLLALLRGGLKDKSRESTGDLCTENATENEVFFCKNLSRVSDRIPV